MSGEDHAHKIPSRQKTNSNSGAFIEMAVAEKSTSISSRAHLPTATKRQNENLARRIETLFVKSHEIWEIYGVDVAVILRKNSQYSTYRSIDEPRWSHRSHPGKASTG
jgi:hypothetical protein